jgi:hypothetical protein
VFPIVVELVLAAGRMTALLDELALELRSLGHEVELSVTEYVPGRRGIAWAEAFWLYIVAATSATLMPLVVTDLYEAAKRWSRSRYEAKRRQGGIRPRAEMFVIFGPDGNPIKRWKIDENGEREDDKN